MKDYIKERSNKEAILIIVTGKTIREVAKIFCVSKSTVHKDITQRLQEINPQLAKEIRKVLDTNFAVKHLRGGESTREKYRKM